jgi:hypothetical protein
MRTADTHDPMSTHIVKLAVVVLANKHNPSIATKDWLQARGVVDAKPDEFVHTPVLSVLKYGSLEIVVDEQRLVLAQTGEDLSPAGSPVIEVARKYVEALPETPYTAAGLNIHGLVPMGGAAEASGALKDRFLSPRAFAPDGCEPADMLMGITFRFPLKGAVCTFDLKPVSDNIEAKLNYHVEGGGLDGVLKVLAGIEETQNVYSDLLSAASLV